MTTDADRAKELMREVVLAQGNIFIKELLREKGRIGATKEDFARNLEAAIDDGTLLLADIEEWIQRVEGWGLQYIYLWQVNQVLAEQAKWRDTSVIRRAARAAGLGDVWGAPTAQAFPEEMTLTHVSYGDGRLLFEWHEAGSFWVREPPKDYTEVEGDDTYRYDAYRQRRERSVMRFEFRPSQAVAAAFIPLPATTGAHSEALNQMFASVDGLVPRRHLAAFNVGQAISRLDEAQLRPGGGFQTQTTRLSGQGAYVEFGSTVPGHGYGEVDPIREVRLAVEPGSVSGNTATILFNAPALVAGPARHVRVQFYAQDGRIWVRAQMTAEQVWALLELIRSIP